METRIQLPLRFFKPPTLLGSNRMSRQQLDEKDLEKQSKKDGFFGGGRVKSQMSKKMKYFRMLLWQLYNLLWQHSPTIGRHMLNVLKGATVQQDGEL